MFIVCEGGWCAHSVRSEMSVVARGHGTPDGVRAISGSTSINMELLAEFRLSKPPVRLELRALESPKVPLFNHTRLAG